MPLATLDRTPPPFFRQGYSALTKLLFFSALAVFLMVADTRFEVVRQLRAAVATALLPVQMALRVPIEMAEGGREYLLGLQAARTAEREAERKLADQAARLARADLLEAENARLRDLLNLRPALLVRSHAAQVLYEASDPYSRKLFIDRGATHGLVAGAPVINDAGVLGQVTRVYPVSSEVTLLADRDAAIPVLNNRTGLRGVAYGGADGGGTMELRFMAGNADVQVGDTLVTSGLDGVYPQGLAVATVVAVDRQADGGFARVTLKPQAAPDIVRHVLVLEPVAAQMPAASAPVGRDGAGQAAAAAAAAR